MLLSKPAAFILCLLVASLLPAGVLADFDLQVLFPVPKTVVVPEDADASLYASLADIRDLTVEVRMSGNMIRDTLVDRLNQTLPEATKRVVLSGEVTEAHVRQLRRVERLEVAYRMGAGGMSARTFNALFDLGPVRKLICIPADATPAQLERVGRLKFYVPVVQVDKQPLSEQLLAWLEGRHKRNNYFILGPDVDPNRIYELTRFRPLHLEFQTRNNRVSEKIMNVIKDLMSVELVIWADGRLTLDDAKRFANLERFGIRVDLGRPPEYTPGLFHLLNRIAPPR